MPPVPTPLTWKRRNFAVLEPQGLPDQLVSVAVTGIVGGPFAVYSSPWRSFFTLIHLPSQAKIISMGMQSSCKHVAEELAALDINWWTCDPKEVIGPDLQALRNTYLKWYPKSAVGTGWVE